MRTLHPRRGFVIDDARKCAPLVVVFVWVKNVGRGRHQPSATGRRSGSLRDSDRKAIGCHRLRLGLGVQIDVLTAEKCFAPGLQLQLGIGVAEELRGGDTDPIALAL